MRFRVGSTILALCVSAALAASAAVASENPTFKRVQARVFAVPTGLNYGNTQLEVRFVETGLSPGETVTYSLLGNAKATFVCKRPGQRPSEYERVVFRFEYGANAGTFTASEEGVIRETVRVGEGDVAGLEIRPFGCPEDQLVRTKIVYYNTVLVDATHGIQRKVPRVTYSRGIGSF
jgi:hypothetical protein